MEIEVLFKVSTSANSSVVLITINPSKYEAMWQQVHTYCRKLCIVNRKWCTYILQGVCVHSVHAESCMYLNMHLTDCKLCTCTYISHAVWHCYLQCDVWSGAC